MTEKQKEAIKKHGEQLNKIFNTGIEPIKLCKKLRQLELLIDNENLKLCNIVDYQPDYETKSELLFQRVDKILKFTTLKIPVFINRDPRGYALKIDGDYIRKNNIQLHTDWGGYGIIAPEIGKEGDN